VDQKTREDAIEFFLEFIRNNPNIPNPIANAVKEYFVFRKLDWEENTKLRFEVASLFFGARKAIKISAQVGFMDIKWFKKIGLLAEKTTYN
jgi:hypothetical protein